MINEQLIKQISVDNKFSISDTFKYMSEIGRKYNYFLSGKIYKNS